MYIINRAAAHRSGRLALRKGSLVPDDVVVYKTAIRVEPVMEALERRRRGVQ